MGKRLRTRKRITGKRKENYTMYRYLGKQHETMRWKESCKTSDPIRTANIPRLLHSIIFYSGNLKTKEEKFLRILFKKNLSRYIDCLS